ncbi:hypothetical protein EVY07_08955 [Enterobacter hormaechei]|uniref:hypothetical protein n=1 Tax=Enterobacter hormaechei TaxID=158836 RepID=UPI00101B6AEA|nr:hypothetical protein [Enterobacter hormaechei]RYH61308.1 hypothetical protein EVY07_08955 [Enterobacter hormaechei]
MKITFILITLLMPIDLNSLLQSTKLISAREPLVITNPATMLINTALIIIPLHQRARVLMLFMTVLSAMQAYHFVFGCDFGRQLSCLFHIMHFLLRRGLPGMHPKEALPVSRVSH